jgi:hypothetical protein
VKAGGKLLQNVARLSTDYMALYIKRQNSTYNSDYPNQLTHPMSNLSVLLIGSAVLKGNWCLFHNLHEIKFNWLA